MYHATTSQPALLPSNWYTDSTIHRREAAALGRAGWQLVTTTTGLSKPGDYQAMDRLGVPLIVRNHDGELVALRNVCAHRQCQLVTEGGGHAKDLKCPYHGWQYGGDGRTRKIPAAKNFPHFDRERYRLNRYPVQVVGQLVFVNLAGEATTPGDDDWVGDFAAKTDAKLWQQVLHEELEYSCDWKIPIEGSLESYHLSEVHSQTFGNDPGENESTHELLSWGTRFRTDARDDSFLARMEERVMRWLVGEFGPHYQHVHVFPNIMASFTDTMSLVYQITPTGTSKSKITVFGFTRRPKRSGIIAGRVASGLGRSAASMARKVLDEDAAIFPLVQAGMNSACLDDTSQQTGRIFGRCEERLHAFHVHWSSLMNSERVSSKEATLEDHHE
ncbi:aromatic ring-hydroxylating oxygenase subunit alpha [Rhodopirellula bahusiensis]|uniref:Ring-hydroxylating oxygenase subunit alpha n=1 Tax=Rhodopirellula bahusiensis TaxID=2014065 RepID=A0A2G1W5H3_9BACT|nr:aromatic ring-hydroxylating dioxygenase subunit alpha [Rhodopirellula bahusiensis]PHQ34276.1 ring-hydroxylating oxygenase subunit alpha [Rhodopirellula bahusiensis]